MSKTLKVLGNLPYTENMSNNTNTPEATTTYDIMTASRLVEGDLARVSHRFDTYTEAEEFFTANADIADGLGFDLWIRTTPEARGYEGSPALTIERPDYNDPEGIAGRIF